MIDITVDTSQAYRALNEIEQNQIPFAAKNAINDVALAFQKAEFSGLDQRFTLRRPDWVKRSIKITHFATKTENWATIKIQPPGADGAKRADILGKFEDQPEKTSATGGYVAIPTENVKRTKNDIIAKSMRPRAFHFRPIFGRTSHGEQWVGDQNTMLVQSRKNPNVQLILQRVGDTLRVLYLLVKRVPIKDELQFHATARQTVAAAWPAAFSKRLAEALATMKR